ncbi:MAG: serine hydrolase, partial [Phaeodactylibacter sp.]|nr:serine hydrolase [Phaeodactylibacter sp.]
MFLKTTLLFGMLCLLTPHCPAQPAVLDQLIIDYATNHGFSGTILLAQSGMPVLQRSFGLANRQTGERIRAETPFAIASVTKLFTAIRILQLVEAGQLKLTDPVVTHVPDTPQKGISKKITIHHLLLHLSGLPNETEQVYAAPLSARQVLEQTLTQPTTAKFGQVNYNNLDYLL